MSQNVARFMHPQFQTDVTKPMLIDQIADHEAQLPVSSMHDEDDEVPPSMCDRARGCFTVFHDV